MKTDADTVAMLRDQIDYVTKTEREWVEIEPAGVERIADDLEDLHRRRAADLTVEERDLVAGAIEELVDMAGVGNARFKETRLRQAAVLDKILVSTGGAS